MSATRQNNGWHLPRLVLWLAFSVALLALLIIANGLPDVAELVAFSVLALGWLVREWPRPQPQTSTVQNFTCSTSVLGDHPFRNATSEQIGRAESLLAQSLSQLRDSFTGLVNEPTDAARRQQYIEAAMIALQSEDTVSQLLRHARARTLRLEQAACLLDVLTRELNFDESSGARDPERQQRIEARLREAEQTLGELVALPQPVQQHAVASGSVQLF